MDPMEVEVKDAITQLSEGKLEPSEARPRYGFGYINGDLGRDHTLVQAKVIEFNTPDQMNKWFEEHGQGALLMSMFPRRRWVDQSNGDAICCLIMRTISEKESDIYTKVQNRVQMLVNEELRLEREAEAKAQEAERQREAELKDLQQLGHTCRSNHGAVIEDNAKLKKQNQKLRKVLEKHKIKVTEVEE